MVALAMTWKGRQNALLRLMRYIGGEYDRYHGNESFHHLDIDRFGHKESPLGAKGMRQKQWSTCLHWRVYVLLSVVSQWLSLYCAGPDPVTFKKHVLFIIYISNVWVCRCSMSTHTRGMLRLRTIRKFRAWYRGIWIEVKERHEAAIESVKRYGKIVEGSSFGMEEQSNLSYVQGGRTQDEMPWGTEVWPSQASRSIYA